MQPPGRPGQVAGFCSSAGRRPGRKPATLHAQYHGHVTRRRPSNGSRTRRAAAQAAESVAHADLQNQGRMDTAELHAWNRPRKQVTATIEHIASVALHAATCLVAVEAAGLVAARRRPGRHPCLRVVLHTPCTQRAGAPPIDLGRHRHAPPLRHLLLLSLAGAAAVAMAGLTNTAT